MERLRQIPSWIWAVAGVVLFGLLFLVSQRLLAPADPLATVLGSSEVTTETSETITETTTMSTQAVIYVDVKGAVKQPALYQLPANSRVQAAIQAAGGFAEQADQNQINLAQILTDQAMIYVPKKGETPPSSLQQPATESSGETIKVNINTASEQELQQLSGIGAKKAADIIQYREANGSFKKIEELSEVSGIGEKTVEKLRPFVTL
ncbi:comEA protein [Enterococcus canis]|uniref:ComEA protein n=1 Tax=Enterococcus canis TaxID=214095 RepID=A0A1L8RIQ1_9ENTE|nr:helix-hairpin-helix domain-containing protein [Enterococcus canis]OJG19639.1 comEA protein [Enterococcus canis]